VTSIKDRTPEASGRSAEPEDARRGYIAPTPNDAREARADREMAAAERAVAQGAASTEQARLVDAISEARTHEERRRLWLEAS
jgi:malic enzyme